MTPEEPAAVAIAHYYDQFHPLTDEMVRWPDYRRFAAFLRTAPHPPVTRIVDIGCAFGVQAVLFPEWVYLGIAAESPMGYGPTPDGDVRPIPFFRDPALRMTYFVTHCPDLDFHPQPGDCFIANLSIGYEPRADSPEAIAAGLARFDQGFFHGDQAIRQALARAFPRQTVLWDEIVPMIGYPRGFRSLAIWYGQTTPKDGSFSHLHGKP